MQKLQIKKNSILFLKKVLLFFAIFLSIHLFNNKILRSEVIEYNSAIVVDAKNGEILYSYNPDKKIYPASLTKLMTAYLVFTAINKEVVGINDKINLYDKTTTIKELIYKMAINSYNDTTNILAIETYGDVNLFIKMMNKKAIDMNMKNTHFNNTHGLFDENHYSTVRDIAKLAIRLIYDFPQYKDIFAITSYIDNNGEYNVKTTKIQNYLKGMEGSKTGYIEASGYNIATWGYYNGRHIFVVVSGLKSKNDRDKITIKLLEKLVNIDDDINKKNKDNNDLLKKSLDFIGIDYNKYMSPKPKQRDKQNNEYYY